MAIKALGLALLASVALATPPRPFDSRVAGAHVHDFGDVAFDKAKGVYLFPSGD